jgi:hypothetical protein
LGKRSIQMDSFLSSKLPGITNRLRRLVMSWQS